MSEPPTKRQRTEPVSLEELVTKKQMEEKEKQKPVFLTAKQREQRALEKRRLEVEEMKKKQAEAREARMRFLREAQESTESQRKKERDNRRSSSSRYGSNRDSRDSRDSGRRNQERNSKSDDVNEKEKEKESSKVINDIPLVGRDQQEAEKELEEIKKQYLGLKEKRKRVIKPSEKYARVFNWDLSDDTSSDFSDIYKNRTAYKPGFGKGFIAGIDRKEQDIDYRKKLPDAKREKFDKYISDKTASKFEIQHNITRKHWTEKSLNEMTERDWRILKEDFNIATRGTDIPRPIRNWKESGLPFEVLDAIEKVGYEKPTPIQMQAIPVALRGRDILGVAETGSGKTAAFLLPMLVYLSKLPPMNDERKVDGPYALILAPVRDLALQIEKECKKFAQFTPFRTVSVVGGKSIESQGFALEQGCEVIIATPGRMIDCLKNHYAVLNQCNYVVLDEADKMIDMGFISQVNEILDSMPSTLMKSEDEVIALTQETNQDKIYRTTIMYSATMPTEIETLAKTFLRRPAFISIGQVGKAADKIEQRVVFVKSDADKKNKLLDIVQNGPPPPIIIFANQKKLCDSIAKLLNQEGFPSTVLHANKKQEAREYALDSFKDGRYDILVATDVAGRGLDVQGVTHVINYDLPKMKSHYIHRIGRTGRAGMDGLATSLMTNDDTHLMWFLKNTLIEAGQQIPPELAKHPAAQFNPELAEKLNIQVEQ